LVEPVGVVERRQRAGAPAQLHTVTEHAIDAQLDQLEKISKQVDLRPLRWAFMHMEAVTPAQVEQESAGGI